MLFGWPTWMILSTNILALGGLVTKTVTWLFQVWWRIHTIMFWYYVKFFFPVLRPILDVHNAVHVPALILERGATRVDLVQDALQIAGIDSWNSWVMLTKPLRHLERIHLHWRTLTKLWDIWTIKVIFKKLFYNKSVKFHTLIHFIQETTRHLQFFLLVYFDKSVISFYPKIQTGSHLRFKFGHTGNLTYFG